MSTTEKRLITLRESDALRAMTPMGPLIKKLAEVMAEVERVAKHGRNDFHKYDYATESDITAAVRKAMADRGIMMIPHVLSLDWRATEKGQPIATMAVEFRVTDGDSHMTFTIIGEGQDSGDKATYKALTGATKYALLKLFLIPTGDDPEREDQDRKGRNHGEVDGKRREANADRRPASLASGGIPAKITVPLRHCGECGEPLGADGLCQHDREWHENLKAKLERESKILLPTPDEAEERAALITKGQQIIKERKLSLKAVKAVKAALLDDENADMLTIDLASLASVVRHLEVAKP